MPALGDDAVKGVLGKLAKLRIEESNEGGLRIRAWEADWWKFDAPPEGSPSRLGSPNIAQTEGAARVVPGKVKNAPAKAKKVDRYRREDLVWHGDVLRRRGSRRDLVEVKSDPAYPTMWRVHGGGQVSGMVNRTRALDAAYSWALEILNRGE